MKATYGLHDDLSSKQPTKLRNMKPGILLARQCNENDQIRVNLIPIVGHAMPDITRSSLHLSQTEPKTLHFRRVIHLSRRSAFASSQIRRTSGLLVAQDEYRGEISAFRTVRRSYFEESIGRLGSVCCPRITSRAARCPWAIELSLRSQIER
jgi:hypothetical protein